MKRTLLLVLTVMLMSCGSPAKVPTWEQTAARHLDTYQRLYLTGKQEAQGPHFMKAVRELASGNDLDRMTVVYLTHFALQIASLERFDATPFAAIERLEPSDVNRAYVLFLQGNFSAVDDRALPARYRDVLKAAQSGDAQSGSRAIQSLADPLSRLIACGAWILNLPAHEAILQMGVDTAAAEGWRRPLLAYLLALQAHYVQQGDEAMAKGVGQRLEVLKP